MRSIDEANRMIDLFTSVGARSFVMTKIDIERNVIWGKPYSPALLHERLPAMVRTAAIRRPYKLEDGRMVNTGENLIVRPTGPNVGFVQLDDLKPDFLERVRPAAFLIHATSPNNYQAWIAVSDAPKGKEEFKAFMRRVRKGVGGNDKSASHATRLAGTGNFKVDYIPDFPVVTIEQAVPGRVMTSEQLRQMGLLAKPEPVMLPTKSYRPAKTDGERRWPSYEMSLAGAPLNKAGTGPSRSDADFWWCYLAVQRGWSVPEIEEELKNVSPKAQERIRANDPGYVTVTAQNAAAAWARKAGSQRNRG